MPAKKKAEANDAEAVGKTMKKDPVQNEPKDEPKEKPEPFELDDILKGNITEDDSDDDGPKGVPDDYEEYKRAYDFLMSLPQDKFDQLTGTAQTQQTQEPRREEPAQANIPQFPNYDDYQDNTSYNRAVQEYNSALFRANNDALLKQVDRVVGDRLEKDRVQRQQEGARQRMEGEAARLRRDLGIDERTWHDFTSWMNEPNVSPYDRLKASYAVYRIDKGKVPRPQSTPTETNNQRRIPSISEMSGVTYAGEDASKGFSRWIAGLSESDKRYSLG